VSAGRVRLSPAGRRSCSTGPGAAPARGFTLVEVLVALAVMALLAGLAWQGVEAMARARDAGEAASQRALRLSTAVAQWEQDLQAVLPTGRVPALNFDGATLRLTRENPQGVQVVAWAWRGGAWTRWAAPAVTRDDELRAAWERSQQLLGTESGTLRLLDGVGGARLAFHRGGWSNAQSAGDRPDGAAPAGQDEKLPRAVRLVMDLAQGTFTRVVQLPPQP
jgi:general secretion pathway protein J